jgi:hypothetical protein
VFPHSNSQFSNVLLLNASVWGDRLRQHLAAQSSLADLARVQCFRSAFDRKYAVLKHLSNFNCHIRW